MVTPVARTLIPRAPSIESVSPLRELTGVMSADVARNRAAAAAAAAASAAAVSVTVAVATPGAQNSGKGSNNTSFFSCSSAESEPSEAVLPTEHNVHVPTREHGRDSFSSAPDTWGTDDPVRCCLRHTKVE